MKPIPPRSELTRAEISNRMMAPQLTVVEQRYGRDFLRETLEQAGLDITYLEDRDSFVSMRFAERRQLAILSRADPGCERPDYDHPPGQLLRAAGHQALGREALGAVWPILRALGTPYQAYKRLPALSNRANKVLVVELLELSRSRAVLRFVLAPGFEELPTGCWSRIGSLEAIPTIWGLPKARITHRECMHDPDQPSPHCTYEVSFANTQRSAVLAPAAAAVAGACLGAGLCAILAGPLAWGAALGASLGYAVERTRSQRQDRDRQRREVREMEDLWEASDRRYQRLWSESEALRSSLLQNEKIAAYLPPELVRQLERRPERPSLGGSVREVTILFTDLAGYSTLSEDLDPAEIVAILNEYFGAMAEAIEAQGGTLLELMGDGILAVFGAPAALDDHASAALRAALGMERKLAALNRDWEASGRARLWRRHGMEAMVTRYGLQTGQVVAGNIGAQQQMKYSVIGDIVNQAARLEALNKDLDTRILMAREVYDALDNSLRGQCQAKGEHRVKGRRQPVVVYTIEPIL